MALHRHKSLMWMIILWFALLQTVAPFIHGHLDQAHLGIEEAHEAHGLHLHASEHGHGFDQPSGQFLHEASHVVHTIAIAPGINKEQDSLVGSQLALLFLIALLVLLTSRPRVNSLYSRAVVPHFKWRLAPPRAPPAR